MTPEELEIVVKINQIIMMNIAEAMGISHFRMKDIIEKSIVESVTYQSFADEITEKMLKLHKGAVEDALHNERQDT